MLRRFLSRAVYATLAATLLLATPGAVRAALYVEAGYDLFHTVSPGTTFNGIEFQGVPLPGFDFTTNTVTPSGTPVGDTDTIVQRLSATAMVNAGDTAPPISIVIRALQLRSVLPVDFSLFGGTGTGFAYVTLQDQQTLGSMTISFDPAATEANEFGTFSSQLPVAYDVRENSLDGTIILSDSVTLASTDVPWTHVAPPDTVKIPGVNYLLNGTDDTRDFWPAPFPETAPTHVHEITPPRPVPEPSGLVLAGTCLIAALSVGRLRRRRAA